MSNKYTPQSVEAVVSIDKLIQRIKELESEYERAWRKIATLEEGACRFHCRTAKDNWIAGYRAACGRGLHFENEAEIEYNGWRERQRS